MKIRASLSFAYRLLFPRTGKKSNARRSLVGAALCIGISLIPLVVVLAVSDGMISGMTERTIGLSSSHISIHLPFGLAEAENMENLLDFSETVNRLDTVVDVYPEISALALAASMSGRTGAYVRAVQPDIFSRNPAFATLFTVISGTTDFAGNTCVIGENLSSVLGVGVGDTIRLITTRTNDSGSFSPKITVLKVGGVVSSGYQELDSLWLFIPLEKGFSVLQDVSSSVTVGVRTKDAFGIDLERAALDIDPIIPQFSYLYRWYELNSAQYENFASTQMMLILIMMLIVLVASVNISSALVMLVVERRREIAILKSLGGSTGGIAFSFLITGIVTGLFGVAIGIPLGFLCAVNFSPIVAVTEKILNFAKELFFYAVNGNIADFTTVHLLDPAFYLQNVSIVLPLEKIILISAGTLVLSFVMSIVPALKAGREKPIETLRKI
ncbi:MAG: ABC transporter permease [Treponema sp.]|nr:ABC transporter permease [Treponema sp.]